MQKHILDITRKIKLFKMQIDQKELMKCLCEFDEDVKIN
jgi:hypothetical protein